MDHADLTLRTFEPHDTESVVALWTECGLVRPWNDPRRDIERKRTVQPELFLVATPTDDPERIVGAGMAGFDGHRGWVNYLAVSPSLQRSGLGRRFMTEFERLLTERGCPKLNLQVRAGNEEVIAFYATLGYTDDRTVSMGKRLISDGVDRPD